MTTDSPEPSWHPRWGEACHEAAHAVAAHHYRWPIASLTIVPGSHSEGRSFYEGQSPQAPDGRWDREAVTIDAIITLAGSLAQAQALQSQALPAEDLAQRRQFLRNRWLMFARGGDDSDEAFVSRNLRGLYASDEQQVAREFDRLCTCTEEFLAPSLPAWAAVKKLATVLCESGTLSGEEATTIIETALKEADA